MLELEERHGVILGNAYCNSISAGIMIDFIAEKLSEDLKETLEQSHFISILTDGSTDASIVEKDQSL